MDCVVAPVDQVFPVAEDDVKTTDPPEQKVVGPPAVMVGAVGIEFTVTVVPADDEDVQPDAVAVTVYVPAVETVIEGVVAPVDQVLLDPADDVRPTDPPEQKVVGPPAVIVGVEGIGLTVIVVPDEADDVQPETVAVTVYVPAVLTVID